MAVSYKPIEFVHRESGLGFPAFVRAPEAASKTFKQGVPVVLSSGNVQEAAFGGSELVYGFSAEPAHNLTAAGTAQDGYSEASPQNQPSAKIIPVGAWIRDGKCGIYRATADAVFAAMLKDGQVFTQALVSTTRYALIKDGTSGFWYIDNTDSGTNDEHAAQIVGVDPSSPNTAAGGARVYFRVPEAARVLD